MKCIRLLFPQWQGGINRNYSIVGNVLSLVLPENSNHKEVVVDVSKDYEQEVGSDEFFASKNIINETKLAMELIEGESPDGIITLCGDCSVSQAPFSYLISKYKEKLGVLWIDAHPDISTPKDVKNEHAMVLGNLLGDGAPSLSSLVADKLKPNQVLYAGLIEEKLLPYEMEALSKFKLDYLTPVDVRENSNRVVEWIEENNFEYIAVHFDLDALSPVGFRSLLCNEPGKGPVTYAVGELFLNEVVDLILLAGEKADLVGLTIAEYLPWDIINMRREFSRLGIF